MKRTLSSPKCGKYNPNVRPIRPGGSLALFGAYSNTVSSKVAQGSVYLYN